MRRWRSPERSLIGPVIAILDDCADAITLHPHHDIPNAVHPTIIRKLRTMPLAKETSGVDSSALRPGSSHRILEDGA